MSKIAYFGVRYCPNESAKRLLWTSERPLFVVAKVCVRVVLALVKMNNFCFFLPKILLFSLIYGIFAA